MQFCYNQYIGEDMKACFLFIILVVLPVFKADVVQSSITPQNTPVYIYAVGAGHPVTWSSVGADFQLTIPRLNANNYCWAHAGAAQQGEWIQVSSLKPVKWVGVILQGRGNAAQWVTAYTVSYTLDGLTWNFVDNLRVFQGNTDQNTAVKSMFTTPVVGRALRINPTSWYGHPSLRFDAIFVQLS